MSIGLCYQRLPRQTTGQQTVHPCNNVSSSPFPFIAALSAGRCNPPAHPAMAQKNYLCHSLHIPPQVFIIRYTALFFNVDSVCFSRISTLLSTTFQQNGVVMVYQTVLYQPDIFRSCRSDDPGKSTSFAICSAAWS